MSELTAKAADEIIKICNDMVIDNINGEKHAPQWRQQKLVELENWALAIRDANRTKDINE